MPCHAILALGLALAAACLLGAAEALPGPKQALVDRVKLSYGRLKRHHLHRKARALRGGEEPEDIDALYLAQIQLASGEHEKVRNYVPSYRVDASRPSDRTWLHRAVPTYTRMQPDPFKPHHVKPCHMDCGKYGTCDHQFGRCLCPFGFTGPTCQEMLLPACRMVNMTVAEAKQAGVPLLLTCAASTYRNCECFRCAGQPSPPLLACAPGPAV
jgi:hypothetical protein